METGVYNHKSVIDFSSVSDYLKELLAKYQKSQRARRETKYRFFESGVDILKRTLEQLDRLSPRREKYFELLTETLCDFAAHCECPEDMTQLFSREFGITISGRKIRRPRPTPIFDSRIIPETKDVVSVERQHIDGGRWFFDVTAIKDSGISAFKKAVACIPPITERIKIVREDRQFSSRYSFRPYPLAAKLWLQDEVSISIPSDLKSFLTGAIDYLSSNEWRPSIVLSAIAVESMLADLYEESHRRSAPDIPLGDLFQLVKTKIHFPEDIVVAIDLTNRARIAAVHRSRLPVSEREAINALFGAVSFARWHLFEHGG